jgi:dTDP-4-amino-4,6-dideoxygalactose transaminase
MTAAPFGVDPGGAGDIEAYEAQLARHFGTAHAVAVSSGTAALHTALAISGIGPGNEVLVPAASVIMSVAPILYVGARPVFVDCDATGADFDYDDLAAKTGPATRAVLPVYLWGRAGDPARLQQFADAHDLTVIEDACQAHGTRIHGQQAGTHGAIGCFSTQANKILTSGEGGFLLTADARLAALARAFRSHWQTPPAGEEPLSRVGHNYRLAAPLAALASTRLASIDHALARRRAQACLLDDLLAEVAGLAPVPVREGEDWNRYASLHRVTLPQPRAFLQHLATQGVPNSVGTFGLMANDQRAIFTTGQTPRCATAAAVLDSTLAVVLTDHDDDNRVRRYARAIAGEAARWAIA